MIKNAKNMAYSLVRVHTHTHTYRALLNKPLT